jgi:hypothetical protein
MRKLAEFVVGLVVLAALYQWAFGSGGTAAGLAILGFALTIAIGALGRPSKAGEPERRDDAPKPAAVPPTGLFDAILRYRDAADSPTERRVTALGIDRMEGNNRLALTAWCHMRHDVRSFRFDRIIQAIDATTGEVAADPARWLLARAGSAEAPDPPPPPRRYPIAADLGPAARVRFRGKRRGDRWALGVVDSIRIAEGRVERADILISGDPAHAEPRMRTLAIGRAGRDGELMAIWPDGAPEPVGDMDLWLQSLPRRYR